MMDMEQDKKKKETKSTTFNKTNYENQYTHAPV